MNAQAPSAPMQPGSSVIAQRVAMAQAGENPYVICRLPSGWLVIGDVQPVPGYCLLLADPVVASINALGEAARADYWRDVGRIGDALLSVTDAYRINYETWGNLDPTLHTHVTPRYRHEPLPARHLPPGMAYPQQAAHRQFDPAVDGAFMAAMRGWFEANG